MLCPGILLMGKLAGVPKNYFNRGLIAHHPFYSVIALLAHIAVAKVLFSPDGKAAGEGVGLLWLERTGAPKSETASLETGALLFSDRNYRLAECPSEINGQDFLRTGIDGGRARIQADGRLYVMTMESNEHGSAQGGHLEAAGFRRVESAGTFQLFGNQPVHLSRLYMKNVKAGERYTFPKVTIPVGLSSLKLESLEPGPWSENDGELLYNNIRLPSVWPPEHFDPASAEPMPVPYLEHPPAVIAIDVGRQLFVDDFLIDETDMSRTFHRAEKFRGNPVFKPTSAEELAPSEFESEHGKSAVYLGHGGVFFDPKEQEFKMFYTAGWRGGLAMASSKDMIDWTRPDLGLDGAHLLLPPGPTFSSLELSGSGTDNSVWFDANAEDPSQRIRFMTCWMHTPTRPDGFHHTLHTSADGSKWSRGIPLAPPTEDYSTFFFNPFRRVWVFSIKKGGPRGRCRYYLEADAFFKAHDTSQTVYWTNADKLDQPEPEGAYPRAGEAPQLYSLAGVAYESLLVGMHYVHRGPANKICVKERIPKLVDLELGFSRDGFHWDRPDRLGFIKGERKEGAWDRAYLHSTTGVFVVMGDQLIFPYTGFSGVAADGHTGIYSGASIGLATLRRDGFASMDAGSEPGTLTTRPVTFSGKRLFVNVDAPGGRLRAEVLDADGKPIEPFTMANSIPFSGDSTLEELKWEGGTDLSALAGQPVRFRFELTNGSLYAFWVSKDDTGRSDGYLAGGGPGYTGVIDTVGRAALEKSTDRAD